MQVTKRLILVGCGAFAREIISWCENLVEIQITGFLDENPRALEQFDYPYNVAWISTIEDYIPEIGDELIMTITDPFAKSQIASKLKQKGAKFVNFIHPTTIIARSALLGEGVVVCPRVGIGPDARIGDFVTINGSSGIGHDVIIGKYSTLSAYVDLTGYVQVGDSVFFGSGARAIPRIKIGSGSKIGAGATIIRSVPANTTMYTPPAKRL